MQDKPIVQLFLTQANDDCDPMDFPLGEAQISRVSSLSGKRRVEYALGRLLLQHALVKSGHNTHRILEHEHSAPSLQLINSNDLPMFSISHSLGWVGVAYCEDSSVLKLGLDIEMLRMTLDEKRASYFCNDAQIIRGQTLGEPDKAAYFTRLWTHKEAYCKSQGISILSKEVKAADFSQDQGMLSGLLGDTYFLSIYSTADIIVEPHFLEPSHNGVLNDGRPVSIIWD